MSKTCCVCETTEAPAWRTYLGRVYCENCLGKITRGRQSWWRASGLVEILSLLVIVGLAGLLGALVDWKELPALRLAVSLLIALAVSFVFLTLFYRQDSLEPEPKRLVAFVFLGGAVLPLLVVNPLLEAVWSVSGWGQHGFLLAFLGNIFVVGAVTELSKLLVVRYTIFLHREFDEILDGVVYMTAAGLGYATALNIQYVFQSSGVDFFVGTVRMATLALLHASISGFIGFYLGKAKFGAGSPLALAMALAAGSLMWGLFSAIAQAAQAGLVFNPWIELAISAVFSFLVMTLTVGLMRRTIRAAERAA